MSLKRRLYFSCQLKKAIFGHLDELEILYGIAQLGCNADNACWTMHVEIRVRKKSIVVIE